MKKIITWMLMMTLVLSLTACGGKKSDAAKDDTEGKTAVQILEEVWATFEEDEKFAIAGGDYENMVMDAPGTVNVADGETLDVLLGFPADKAELLDDGASMMHMMNQNTFTAGVYHVTKADDVKAIADAAKDNIMNRQWMCGFPDDLVICSVGNNYVAIVFGAEEIVDNFEEGLAEVFASTKTLYDEDLTF